MYFKELVEMYMLETMESEILKHLYEIGILGINGGWEEESKLDKKAVDELYKAKLVDKSISKVFIRLSESGVGAVLFGFRNAGKISDML